MIVASRGLKIVSIMTDTFSAGNHCSVVVRDLPIDVITAVAAMSVTLSFE
jgi:hypothetical protein